MANQINIDIGAAANDGTGDPLRTAFNYVNNNFSNVWNTGLPNSNVQFSDNRILTVNTNANLVLAPNGIAKVVSNVSIVPNMSNVHSIGGSDRRWNTIYAQYLNISNDATFGDLIVDGNLTVTGNIIEIGNIVTDAKTIQLANTAGTANAANGSGITVGASDNIATLLYNSTSNTWNTNIGVTVTGNVTGNYILGNGSLLTGLAATYGNANVAAYLPTYTGNISAGNAAISSLVATQNIFGVTATFTGDQYGDGAIYVGTPAGTVLGSDVVLQITANSGGYSQTNFQNINSGVTASGDYIITADNGNDSTHFIDLGMTSSNWNDSEPNVLDGLGPNNGYLYVQDGNLTLGTRAGNVSYSWKFDTTGTLTVGGDIATDAADLTLTVGTSDWVFDETGVLTAPGEIETVGNITGGNLSTTGNVDANNITVSNQLDVLYNGSAGLTIDVINPAATMTAAVGKNLILGADNGNAYVGIGIDGIFSGPGSISMTGNITGGNLIGNVYRNGNVKISADTSNWTFNNTGVLTLPADGGIRGTTGLYSLSLSQIGGCVFVSSTNTDYSRSTQIALAYESGVTITADTGTPQAWIFSPTGNLTAPGNITTTGNISVGNILAQNIRTINGTVYLGQGAGLTNQGTYAIAVGRFAGSQDQGGAGLAIGQLAGQTSQGQSAIALGLYAGANTQSGNAVAIGTYAGQTTQGTSAVAIGRQAGIDNQGALAVAIGTWAGNTSQGGYSVAIGPNAGANTQGQNSVAIGVSAAREAQGNAAISIGQGSGTLNQGAQGIAIGDQAGQQTQSANAIAIGTYAGYESAGVSSISIGTGAGYYIANNSIVINATGANLDGNTASAFYVNPVRNDVSNIGNVLIYNPTSKEVTYGNTISVAGNITAGNLITSGNISMDWLNVGNIGNIAVIAANALFQITANAASNTAPYWTFNTDGTMYVPGNISGDNGGALIIDGNGLGEGIISLPATAFGGEQIAIVNKFSLGNGIRLETNGGNLFFDNDGVLNVPGNIVMPPGTSLTGSGASPAPRITGFTSVSAETLSATGNITGGNISVTGNIAGSTAGYAIGYRDIPQVSFAGNATIATTDAGKHYYSTQSTSYTLTIANNASQGFQVGAAITIVNQGTGNITIAQGSGVTLYMAGNASSGNRSVATFGMATIMKVATDTWFVSGVGVA